MLIGYVRVSKSDGTQTLAPQQDAMLAAGVDPARICEDLASGHRERPTRPCGLSQGDPARQHTCAVETRQARSGPAPSGQQSRRAAHPRRWVEGTDRGGPRRPPMGAWRSASSRPSRSSSGNLLPSAPCPVWPPRGLAEGWADGRARLRVGQTRTAYLSTGSRRPPAAARC
jgi:hypothetical protein